MVIYDIHGSKLMDAILTEGAVLERELGKTDVVKLSWKSDKKSTLPVGAYIVPFSDGLKYRLLDDYTPSEDSTCVKYEPAFNHPLAILSRIPFLYDTTDQDGNPIKQQEWAYDGLTTNALEYACKAINEALGITDENKKFTYTLCGTVDATISFSVSSNDILSVLSSMAQACKDNSSEWHLSWEDHTLYFGQIFINLGEKIPLLKVHDNINPATINSSNEPYYNCFYPQGSSRNMSRKAQVGLGNVATLVRLGLNRNKFPDGCIYVDKDSNVITKDAFVQSGAVKQMVALSFDDVYPHIDLYAYNVRPRYRYLKNRQTNEIEKDASGKNKVYTTWYMRLAYPTTVKDGTKTLVNTTNDIDEHGKQVTHYWYDYELNVKEQVLQGHTLKATFKVNTHATDGKYDALTQSLVGQPNGQDGFELAYFDKNDAKEIPSNQNDGDSGINIKAGDYEIMFYQNGDVIIPTNQEEGLYPRGNNIPDLTCNIVVLFNIKQGQQEIASAQEELAKRTQKEIERRFKDNNNYTFSSNPVAFEEKNPNLHIGQKVIFNDGQGYELSTRVIKIESKIDFPFIQSITVGNQAVKGAITQLKEEVKSILSGNFSGGGGLNASQIETVVKNYTLPRFLRKDVADEAKGHITFWQGLTALVKSFFNGIVNNGNIRNKGDITNSGNIMTNNLTVTGKATFFELEIQKAKAAGGMSVNSAGSFHIDAVVETEDGFVCYQRAEKDGVKLSQTCEVSDQMMCSNGMNILEGGKGNHFYWRKATEAPKEVVMHTIDGKEEKCLKLVLSKTDHSKNTVDIPQVGDDLVQIGNPDNKERQSVMMSCAYNSFDPELKPSYWAHYVGVNDYEISKHRYTWFAANGSNVTGNFKVQSDNGGLESIEDYVKGLANNTVVWHVAFSIRSITGKQGETFKLKYGRTVGENTTWYGDIPSYNGFDQLYVVIIDGATGNEQQAALATDLKVAAFYTGGSLTVHLMNNKTGEILAQDTIYPEAKQGKDAIAYKLIPISENALAYFTEDKEKYVDLKLKYKIQKSVGEQVNFATLEAEGMTLTVHPDIREFDCENGFYCLEIDELYDENNPVNSYTVTLKKGGDIVDQRIVAITFKPNVVFNIDTENGKIRSDITNVKGDMNLFEQDIKKTKATVGNLSKEFTQLQMTSKEISLTVNNGTRPNLLWGSDLNLDGVDTTNKAAIEKHLGVVISDGIELGNRDMFEYLKSEGVGGSDAIRFKNAYKREGWRRWTNIIWKDVPLKPHTQYTISVWVKFKSYGRKGRMYVDCNSDDGRHCFGGYLYKEHYYDRADIDEWQRVRYVFDSGSSRKMSRLYFCCVADEEEGAQCEIWLCHPKLEEGDTATPWCAYDGTVEGLKRTGIDIETGEITLDAEKTTVKGDLTARSLQTEGDPSKGGATIVAKGGMFTVYGVNKSVPGMEIGLNEAGEPVLKMYKNGKFMYDLGPDTIFEQVIERENAFTPCDMHRICNTAGNDMEKSFGGDFPSNYRKMVAYVFSEGYKRVGNQTRYKVSDTKEISTYNGVHFAEQRSVSVINENELESMSRIADGWYLNGGGPRVSDPSEPAYDGSNPQGYTCRRFGVRYYSNGKATSKLGSFTVCGNSQTGWTVEKIDIPFL